MAARAGREALTAAVTQTEEWCRVKMVEFSVENNKGDKTTNESDPLKTSSTTRSSTSIATDTEFINYA